MEIAEVALARINAQQLVLMALITSHPNPAAFAAQLEQLFAHAEVDWAADGQPKPEVRAVIRDFVEELIDVAKAEAQHRQASV